MDKNRGKEKKELDTLGAPPAAAAAVMCCAMIDRRIAGSAGYPFHTNPDAASTMPGLECVATAAADDPNPTSGLAGTVSETLLRLDSPRHPDTSFTTSLASTALGRTRMTFPCPEPAGFAAGSALVRGPKVANGRRCIDRHYVRLSRSKQLITAKTCRSGGRVDLFGSSPFFRKVRGRPPRGRVRGERRAGRHFL